MGLRCGAGEWPPRITPRVPFQNSHKLCDQKWEESDKITLLLTEKWNAELVKQHQQWFGLHISSLRLWKDASGNGGRGEVFSTRCE